MIRRDEDVSSIMEKGNFFVPAGKEEPEVAKETSTWDKSMKRIIPGMAMYTVTMGFFENFYLVPGLGIFFVLWGLWKLRDENKWFRGAFALAVIMGLWMIPVILGNNSSEKEAFFQDVRAVEYMMYGLDLGLFACLLAGIKREDPEAEVRFLWGSMILTGILTALLILQQNMALILPISAAILVSQYLAMKKI